MLQQQQPKNITELNGTHTTSCWLTETFWYFCFWTHELPFWKKTRTANCLFSSDFHLCVVERDLSFSRSWWDTTTKGSFTNKKFSIIKFYGSLSLDFWSVRCTWTSVGIEKHDKRQEEKQLSEMKSKMRCINNEILMIYSKKGIRMDEIFKLKRIPEKDTPLSQMRRRHN